MGKEEIKLSLFADGKIYLSNPKILPEDFQKWSTKAHVSPRKDSTLKLLNRVGAAENYNNC